MTVADFARRVVSFRDMTGASVISWGRTYHENERRGAHRASLHLVDLAVDVTYDKPIDLDTVRRLADGLGLAVRREARHDHLEPLPGGN